CLACGLVDAVLLTASKIGLRPVVEAMQIDEIFAQARQSLLCRAIAELAKEVGVVHGAALHELEQILNQRLVTLISLNQPETATHQLKPLRFVERQEQVHAFP